MLNWTFFRPYIRGELCYKYTFFAKFELPGLLKNVSRSDIKIIFLQMYTKRAQTVNLTDFF